MRKNCIVVAFAFGAPGQRSNQYIGQIASRKARKLGGWVYTQLEVPVNMGTAKMYIKDNRPTVLRIARAAVYEAKRFGIRELWIAAAPPHLWRCLRDLRYAVDEADAMIEIKVCKEIMAYSKNEWFCSKLWRIKEGILRLLPMFLYRWVAN